MHYNASSTVLLMRSSWQHLHSRVRSVTISVAVKKCKYLCNCTPSKQGIPKHIAEHNACGREMQQAANMQTDAWPAHAAGIAAHSGATSQWQTWQAHAEGHFTMYRPYVMMERCKHMQEGVATHVSQTP